MADGRYIAALQAHTNGRSLELPANARVMQRELRAALFKAHRARKILTSPKDIERRVTLLDEDRIRDSLSGLFKKLREREHHRGAFCIFGGVKNQGRDAQLPHFRREDGAWFDFSVTLREADGCLHLLAYDFELRFAPGMGTPFIRFDLNLPDHRNQERDLRCHLHAGSDDILLPAPMMSPAELLALFIEGARLPADRMNRTRTDFETRWLRDSLEHGD